MSKKSNTYISVGLLSLLLVTTMGGAYIFETMPTLFNSVFASSGARTIFPSKMGPLPSKISVTPRPTIKPPIISKSTPAPTPKPAATSVPYGAVTDANLVVNQEVAIARPDDKDPNNYYFIRVVGVVQNNNAVKLSDVHLTSSYDSWYGVLQPQLISMQLTGLPKNPNFNGMTDLVVTDGSRTPVLAAKDADQYGPDQAQIIFDIRVKRYTQDITVQNLLTFQARSKDVNKGLYNQSLIPVKIPAKVK